MHQESIITMTAAIKNTHKYVIGLSIRQTSYPTIKNPTINHILIFLTFYSLTSSDNSIIPLKIA